MPFVLGDDFLYALKFPKEGFVGSTGIESMQDYFNSQINHYNNYNNRIAPHALLQIILLLPTFVFDLTNVIVFLALPWFIIKPFLQENLIGKTSTVLSKNLVLYFSVLLFLWCFHYDLGRSYLWTTGSVNYSWFLIFQLMFVGRLYKRLMDNMIFQKSSIVLAFLICTTNENVVLSLFVITLIVMFYQKAIKLKQVEKTLIFSSIILLCGGLIMLKSPALALRIENESFQYESVMFKFSEYLKRQTYFIACGLSALIFILMYRVKYKQKKKMLFFGIIFFVSSAAMFLAPLYEARSSVFAFLIFLMFILSSLDLNKIKSGYVLVFLIFFSLALFPERIHDVKNIKNRYDINWQKIKYTQDDSSLTLVKFCEEQESSVAVCDELSYDIEKFENKVLAAFLQKETVQLEINNDEVLRQVFLDGFKNGRPTTSKMTHKKVGEKLTDDIILDGVFVNKNEVIIELSKKRPEVAINDLAYIFRGVNKGKWRHHIIKFLPLSVGKYFLHYLEEETIVDSDGKVFLHTVFDTEEYESFIIALYNKYNHNVIGNQVKVAIK